MLTVFAIVPGSWQDVGTNSSNPVTDGISGASVAGGGHLNPEIALDTNGVPYIAWEKRVPASTGGQIYLRTFNGTNWVEIGGTSASLGGLSNSPKSASEPSIAINPTNNRPYVAYRETAPVDASDEIYLKYFDGISWVGLGGSATAGGLSHHPLGDGSYEPSLAISATGDIYVAWREDTPTAGQIYVRRYDSGSNSWVGVGSAGSGGGVNNETIDYDVSPFIAVNPVTNQPCVVWDRAVSSPPYPDQTNLRCFNGIAWVELGSSASGNGVSNNPTGYAFNPRIAFDSTGKLYVTWNDTSIRIKTWNGSAWVNVGTGSLLIATSATFAVPFVNPADNNLYVSWSDYNGTNGSNFVQRFNGTAWEGLGSANGLVMSNIGNGTTAPWMTISSTGNVYTAWSNYKALSGASDFDVFVMHFNTPLPTATPTSTSTATATATQTATVTSSATASTTPTSTATYTPSASATASDTATSTSTPTETSTSTETATATSTATATASATSTATATSTASATPTSTYTPTVTPTVLHPDTIGIYRASNGTFYLRNSNTTGFADTTLTLVTANATYLPITGDWNGDGIDTPGEYRSSTGQFYLTNGTTNPAAINYTFVLGVPGDQPIVGDWDGDGKDSVGVYRPSNGLIYLKNALTTGFADFTMVLGSPGDVGIAGDWNGDGKDSPGVYRPSNANFYLTNQVCNCIVFADYQLTFGIPGDTPFVGDWDGDGKSGVGVYRRSSGLTYLKNGLTTGFADYTFVYGSADDFPLGGYWVRVAGAGASAGVTAPTFQPNP